MHFRCSCTVAHVATLRRSIVLFDSHDKPLLPVQSTMSNFQLILDALNDYTEQTGINIKDNPFADKIQGCDSPSSILLLLQENVKAFKEYRDKNRKFIDCLSPVVNFVHAFSGIFSEAAVLVSHEDSFRSRAFFLLYFLQSPFQPACLIFVGINGLFTVCIFLAFELTRCAPLISIHIRRLKESVQAMTPSLNFLNASEAS